MYRSVTSNKCWIGLFILITYNSFATQAQQCSATCISGGNGSASTCLNSTMADIQFSTIRATGIGLPTGLPAGLNASWVNNTITISGTPVVFGQFSYSIPLIGNGCASKTANGVITVNPLNSAGAPSVSPRLILNSPVSDIFFSTNGATGIGSPTGLPNGLLASWYANTIIISGTPVQEGTFYYSIPLTGGCGNIFATGSLSSKPLWRGIANSDWSNPLNWAATAVPANEESIVLDRYAENNLVLDTNHTLSSVDFNESNKLIVLGNYDLIVSGQVLGANATNYFQTVYGTLRRDIANLDTFLFPVGRSSYNPVFIKNRTGFTDRFGVRVYDEIYSNGSGSGSTLSTPRVKRSWSIDKQSVNCGSGVDFVFHWNPSEEVNLINPPSLLHFNNNNWFVPSAYDLFDYSVSAHNFTTLGYKGAFSTFAIGQANGPLPVNWLSFTGELMHQTVKLKWSTSQEQNNVSFEIERSGNGVQFNKIGTVPSALIPSSVNEYSFIDLNPASAFIFYRLKQIDNDGKYSYSPMIKVDADANSGFSHWANAPSGILYLQVPQRVVGTALITVYDASGHMLLKKSVLAGLNEISFRPCSNGVYIIQVIQSGKLLHSAKVLF